MSSPGFPQLELGATTNLPPKPPPLLCQQCKAMHFRRLHLPAADPDGGPGPRVYCILHPTRESFLESLRLGCRFCVLISSILNMDEPDQPYSSEPGRTLDAFIFLRMHWAESFRFPAISKFAMTGGMWVESKAMIVMPRSVRLQLHQRHVSERYDIERRWPLLPEALHAEDEEAAARGDMTTGSMANFELVRLWLSECQNHGPCNRDPPAADGRPRTFPLRLINVENPQFPFLQETNNIPNPRYAALSYCWGEGSRATTTMSTLSAFQTSLPLSRLPKTFRDAIHATHKLGLTFLWIDALCIVQDTYELVHQISIMDSVYQNAVLTIAARGAPSAHHGLFFRRDARCTRPLQLRDTEDATPGVSIKLASLKAQSPDYLRRRGWVLQETLLSRRILAYDTDQLRWLCKMRHASESEPDPRGGGGGALLLCHHPRAGTEHVATNEKPHCFERWYRLAEDFSQRDLSVASDGLPALAGLAHHFCVGHWHDRFTYLAGIWQNDIQAGLAWYLVQSPWRAYKPVGGTPLPTWSWLSAGQNAVEFRAGKGAYVGGTVYPSAGVEFISSVVTPYNERVPFGAVQAGGCIWLRGMLKKAELRWDWKYWMSEPAGGSTPNATLGRHHEQSGEKPRFPALICCDGRPVGTAALDGYFAAGVIPDAGAGNLDAAADFQEVKVRKEVWCLLILVWRSWESNWYGSCLVLERTAEGYKRIGLLFLPYLGCFGIRVVRTVVEGGLVTDILVAKPGQILVPETVKVF
ncbi:heterokaryon incompatibility protein-domain-containing protein [Podospora conica]|nr:heterokaryon incompatibility protein-domain-containing protein [Schizothecium conicum]